MCFIGLLLLIFAIFERPGKAEAGSAGEQPARNISGYLSIHHYHQAAFSFLVSSSFFVSFMRYDFPFMLTR